MKIPPPISHHIPWPVFRLGYFYVVYKSGPRQLFEPGWAVKNQQVNFTAILEFTINCIASRAEKGCVLYQRTDGPISEIYDCIFHRRIITEIHAVDFIKAGLTQMGLDCSGINGLQLSFDLHMGVSSVWVSSRMGTTLTAGYTICLKDTRRSLYQLAALVPVNFDMQQLEGI